MSCGRQLSAGVFTRPEIFLWNQRLLFNPRVVEVLGHLIWIGNDRTTHDSVEIEIGTCVVRSSRIGSPTAHLVTRKNIDLICLRTLLVGDPVHVEAIEVVAKFR